MKFNQKLNIFYSEKISSIFLHGFGTKISSNFDFFDCQHKIYASQAHSDKIKVITDNMQSSKFNIGAYDGLVTDKTKYLLEIYTADCIPIIYTDQKNKRIGISHQGWRGTLLNLPKKMITTFLKMGSKIDDITVSIGPGIGICCYDISEDRAYEFLEKFPEFKESILQEKKGSFYLNLGYLNYLVLIGAGIEKGNIDYSTFCTKCNNHLFYSFRKEVKKTKNRMTNYVMIS